MPKCPHCKKEISTLEHGIYACLRFKGNLTRNKFNEGFEDNKPLKPYSLDVMSEWYSCPLCKGSIVDETHIKDNSGHNLAKAAEAFLRKGGNECLKS